MDPTLFDADPTPFFGVGGPAGVRVPENVDKHKRECTLLVKKERAGGADAHDYRPDAILWRGGTGRRLSSRNRGQA